MPTIQALACKSQFKDNKAQDQLDSILRRICAPALTTPDYKVKRKTGLMINIDTKIRLDRRIDLFLIIEAFGPPEVESRNAQLIAAKIKTGLLETYPDLRFAGWVHVGSDKAWFSTYIEDKSVAEIEEELRLTTISIAKLFAGNMPAQIQLRNQLEALGITTALDLTSKTEAEVLALKGIAGGRLERIKAMLELAGLSLKAA